MKKNVASDLPWTKTGKFKSTCECFQDLIVMSSKSTETTLTTRDDVNGKHPPGEKGAGNDWVLVVGTKDFIDEVRLKLEKQEFKEINLYFSALRITH